MKRIRKDYMRKNISDGNGHHNGNGHKNGNGHHNANGLHNGNSLHNGLKAIGLHLNGSTTGKRNGISSIPDETLLKRISRHQQTALSEFYGRHNGMLRNVVESFVHEGAETDDVL